MYSSMNIIKYPARVIVDNRGDRDSQGTFQPFVGSLLLTWINFNLSLERFHRWSLGMDK